jgi:Uma2 family endonuclease
MTPTVDDPIQTLADLLESLGDVPPDRVLWNPKPGTATEADLLRETERPRRRLCELIDRTLVEKPMGYPEAILAAALIQQLMNFVQPRRLGIVAAPDALMRLAPGTVRLPDVSFVAWGRLPTPDAHRRPIADFAPDLAVEILSRSNTRREMERKRREYFAAGTRLVWEVDPVAATVDVYADAENCTRLTAADTLDGGAVLPGFALRLADLFAAAEPPPA